MQKDENKNEKIDIHGMKFRIWRTLRIMQKKSTQSTGDTILPSLQFLNLRSQT